MTKKIQNSVRAFLFLMLTSMAFHSQAQDWKTDKKVNVVFGLTQPLLVKGFNIEGNYIHNRLIFDYSHGVSLDFSESSVTPDLKRQGLAVHMPWTTGFGVGLGIGFGVVLTTGFGVGLAVGFTAPFCAVITN